MNYTPAENDEIEDLYDLLAEAKYAFPDMQGVISGATASNYQRLRIENVWSRLSLTSFAPLWKIKPEVLFEEITSSMECITVRTAAEGLEAEHCGKTLQELRGTLMKLK